MIEVKLHDIVEGLTEGEILHFFVKPGDRVQVDQPVAEVQTDKMVAELPSPASGIVKKIVVEEGETVEVGTVLLYIENEDGHQADKMDKKEMNVKERKEPEKRNTPPSPFGRVLATPYTRKIARDHQINIEEVPPSDPSGRVTEEDVYQYIRQKQQQKSLPKTPEEKCKTKMEGKQLAEHGLVEEVPLTRVRKQISEKMKQSLFTIPHVTSFDEVDMTKLMKVAGELKESGTPITIAAFLIKAVVKALKDFPVFNAELDEKCEKIILKKYYNIGIAVDTPQGLFVPVIQDADKKSVKKIHDEVKRLNEKARNGNLTPGDVKNGTFTVSNVGPLGSTGATPIINAPETELIAFHKTRKMPVSGPNDEIRIARMMNVSFSFDHRVADGLTAVQFINRFKELVEEPHKLFLELI